MKKNILFLTISLGLATAPGVWAQSTLFNNLSYATSPGEIVYGSVGGSGFIADSFTTLSTESTLTTVDLLLRRYATSETGSTTIGLYADDSTSPGALLDVLGTITDSSLPYGSYAQYNLTPAVSLAPDAMYWIGITALNADLVSWEEANDASGIGTTGEYFFWNSAPVAPDREGPFGLEVSVTAVPEPSTLALAGLGGASLLLYRRRK
jgi:hypothetical protein